jgi:selenocysteine lyase/cysteine desulfurase
VTIHLNTAGAAIPLDAVTAAMARYLAAERALGPYEAEVAHAQQLDTQIYLALARLIGGRPDEIALFGSATDAWCRVVCHLDLPARSRIWVTPYEYAGNLIAMQRLAERCDATLEIIPLLPAGDLDLDWMQTQLDDRVGLVSLTHMPSGLGIVLPIAEVGSVLAGSPAVYAVDACQTVGQIDLDVGAIGCDLLTGAGRKFLRGPRGCGFAHISRALWDRVRPPFHDLHAAEVCSIRKHRITVDRATRFETAERSPAIVLGLLAAVEDALGHLSGAAPEVFQALASAIEGLPGVRGLTAGSRRAGIVSFVHDRCSPERIRSSLAEDGIIGWVGVGAHTPLYLAAGGVSEFVRLSVHCQHGTADVESTERSLVAAVAG